MAGPAARRQLRRTGLVLRILLIDPDCALTVDGKSSPPSFTCGPADLAPDLVLRMPADVLHRVWLSEIRLRDAYASGQVKVEGLLVRAFGLARLFREVEALYPTVLRDSGLLPAAP